MQERQLGKDTFTEEENTEKLGHTRPEARVCMKAAAKNDRLLWVGSNDYPQILK